MGNKLPNIKDRVLQVAKFKGYTLEDFCSAIGMTYGSFTGKAKDSPLDSRAIENILLKIPDLNADWLLTGNPPMLRQLPMTAVHEPSEIYGKAVIIEPESVLKGIPLIPINAMAGYGDGDGQIMDYEGERFLVPTFRGAEFLIQVKGSSMTPKYNSGDIVACKKLDIKEVFYQPNKVYVLDTDQGALIKRVNKSTVKNHILIVSENPKYDAFDLPGSKVRAVAIVMGVIRLE